MQISLDYPDPINENYRLLKGSSNQVNALRVADVADFIDLDVFQGFLKEALNKSGRDLSGRARCSTICALLQNQ